MHSTSTEKIAALLVSVSFVNISRTLPPAVSSAECSCLVVGSRSGSDPWSRRRAGSGLALLRSVHATRNYRILLLCEGIYVPQGYPQDCLVSVLGSSSANFVLCGGYIPQRRDEVVLLPYGRG